MEIDPVSGVKNPVIMRIVVLFPAPLGPRSPAICPAGSSKETLVTALSVENDFEISRTRIMCVSQPLVRDSRYVSFIVRTYGSPQKDGYKTNPYGFVYEESIGYTQRTVRCCQESSNFLC